MATLSFTTQFQVGIAQPKIVFTDTTNYAGQGIATADVVGDFICTSPSGIFFYVNTDFSSTSVVDIYIDNSLVSQQLILLPLGADGLVESGVYTFLYTVYDSNLDEYYTQTNTVTYNYVSPVVTITQTVDCVSPLFSSLDTTNYIVNGITPTKTEVHTINYPFGSEGEGSPLVGSDILLTTSQFWNGVQNTQISSTLSYTFSVGFTVTDVVTGTQNITVDCTDTCAIYCCLRALEQRMMGYATTNTLLYNETKSLFSQAMGLVGMVWDAIRCGKPTDVSTYLTTLRLLLNCTDDCSCSDGSPAQVTGVGGLVNQVIVQSGGSPVEVATVTVGNTTTYTVTLSTAFINQVNALNPIVAGGDNISVVATGTNPITYTIDGLDSFVDSTDSSIGVTVTGPVDGVTTYDLSVVLDSGRDETDFNTPFVLTVASDIDVTGAIATIPSDGTYLITYEADIAFSGLAIYTLVYRLRKNSTTNINLDRVLLNSVVGTEAVQNKIYCNAIAALVAGDVVQLNVDSNNTKNITGRSITYVKLSS